MLLLNWGEEEVIYRILKYFTVDEPVTNWKEKQKKGCTKPEADASVC